MNFIQKTMLSGAAEKFKKEGVNRILIDWDKSPDDENFITIVSDNEVLTDAEGLDFLVKFYQQNKHK